MQSGEHDGRRAERSAATAGEMATLALLAGVVAACSSGGGGGDEDVGFKPVPSVVTFTLGSGGAPLEVEYAGETVDVDVVLSGFYNVNLDEWATDVGTALTLDSGTLFGVLEVTVLDRLQGTAWDVPRSGTLQVRQVSSGDVVTIGVVSDGVEILYDDGGDGVNVLGPFPFTWIELYEIPFGTPAAEYEEIAAGAWAIVELARERFLIVYQVFASIFELGDFLESIGPGGQVEVPDGCETLPGSGTVGDGFFVWNDDNANGLVDTGDSFSVRVIDCWVDSPGPVDSLFDGMLQLTGFSCSQSPFATGASIEFQDLSEQITAEAGGVYVVVPDSETITRGDAGVAFD